MKVLGLKKLVFSFIFLTTGVIVFAQSAGAPDPYFFDRFWGNIILAIALVTIAAVFATLIYLANLVIKLREIRMMQEQGIEIPQVEAATTTSAFERWYKQLTGAVPIEREADVMLDHNYDGIQELDNSLPPWWVATFYITIGIGIVYFGYYHIWDYGMSSTETYAVEMAFAEEQKARYLAKLANKVNENNVELLTDETALATGKQIYTLNCVACHGTQGEGGVGPNFADRYWLHGNAIGDVFKTIKYGVPEKGMIAWSNQLSPSDIHKVASYILTFEGTNPPNQKEPQGELYEAPSGSVDSTATSVEAIGMK